MSMINKTKVLIKNIANQNEYIFTDEKGYDLASLNYSDDWWNIPHWNLRLYKKIPFKLQIQLLSCLDYINGLHYSTEQIKAQFKHFRIPSEYDILKYVNSYHDLVTAPLDLSHTGITKSITFKYGSSLRISLPFNKYISFNLFHFSNNESPNKRCLPYGDICPNGISVIPAKLPRKLQFIMIKYDSNSSQPNSLINIYNIKNLFNSHNHKVQRLLIFIENAKHQYYQQKESLPF